MLRWATGRPVQSLRCETDRQPAVRVLISRQPYDRQVSNYGATVLKLIWQSRDSDTCLVSHDSIRSGIPHFSGKKKTLSYQRKRTRRNSCPMMGRVSGAGISGTAGTDRCADRAEPRGRRN